MVVEQRNIAEILKSRADSVSPLSTLACLTGPALCQTKHVFEGSNGAGQLSIPHGALVQLSI